MKKNKILDLYEVDKKYIRDLQKKDDNVMSSSPQIKKETRKYIGIVTMINGRDYCIPLTSGEKQKFQEKNSSIDMIKIFDTSEKGEKKVIAVLNINNMIPVHDSVIKKINISISKNDNQKALKDKRFLAKEINWCRKNSETIINRANKVYELVVDTPEKSTKLRKRCCNFKKLEDVLDKRLEKTGKIEKKFLIEKENNRLAEIIKGNGLKPNYLLISTYKEINSYYKKDMSIKSICQLYKTPDLIPSEIESEIKAFGDECAAQQIGKDDPE